MSSLSSDSANQNQSDTSSIRTVRYDQNRKRELQIPIHYRLYSALTTNSLNSMSYKELQQTAKFFNIPLNLKKNILKTLIQYNSEGKFEEAGNIVRQIKSQREERKRKRREAKYAEVVRSLELDDAFGFNAAEHGFSAAARNVAAETHDPAPAAVSALALPPPPPPPPLPTATDRDDKSKISAIVKMNREITPNITICKTETQAHYRAYVEGEEVAGYSSLNSMTRYTPYTYHHQPDFTKPTLWGHSSYNSAAAESSSSEAAPPRMMMHHQLNQGPSFHVDPPKFGFGLDEMFGFVPRNRSVPLMDSLMPRPPRPLTANYQHSNYNQYQIANGNSSVTANIISAEQKTPFGYLANSSITQHSSDKQHKIDDNRPLIGTPCETYNLKGLGIIPKTEPDMNDFPTWNNFLEKVEEKQMSTPIKDSTPEPEAVEETALGCKWGCPSQVKTLDQQLEHEASCFMRSMQCPMPVCQSVFMLSHMHTHIFNAHNLEVINSPEASYPIALGQDPYTYFCDPAMDGIKRLCFLQLVYERLFVISVIGNYKVNQVTVYIQYVNDDSEALSMASLEVCQQTGAPYQWLGRVHPLTYSPVQLTARRRCLVFHMGPEYLSGSTNYLLHTRINYAVHSSSDKQQSDNQ